MNSNNLLEGPVCGTTFLVHSVLTTDLLLFCFLFLADQMRGKTGESPTRSPYSSLSSWTTGVLCFLLALALLTWCTCLAVIAPLDYADRMSK
jgi:hypothetical protein